MNGTNSTGDATGTARVGWVSPPNVGRSTWGIIWSCLAVFLLCSWKCTHLNIPSVEESEAGWHRLRCLWKCTHLNISSVEESEAGWQKVWCIPIFPEKPLLRKWGRKLMFMGLIAIAPEVVVALAVRQFMEARDGLQRANQSHNNGRKYTMAHAMFADMGGFVVHYYDDSPTQEAETESKTQERDTGADAETPVVKEAIDTRSEALRKAMQNGDGKPSRAQSLSLSQVAKLEKYGISFNLEEEDIRDRSKADPFTKAFALVQAGWLVLQSCARKSAGLQITELELMTMAFTACALVTYILWWHKPFDAERSAIVSLPKSCHNVIQDVQGYSRGLSKGFTEFRQTQCNVDFDWDSFIAMVADVSDDRGRMTPGFISSLTLYVFGAIFSAIHFAAWNWDFSLPIVQTLWRSFCCAALGSATLPLVIVRLIQGTWDYRIQLTLAMTPFILNAISRLALIGLTFYCFNSMPASTYQDLDWTVFIPHFS